MRYVLKHIKKILLLTIVIGIAIILFLDTESRRLVIEMTNDAKEIALSGQLSTSINKQEQINNELNSVEPQDNVTEKVEKNRFFAEENATNISNNKLFNGKYYSGQHEIINDSKKYIKDSLLEQGYAYTRHEVSGNINASIHQLTIDPQQSDIRIVLGNDSLFGKEKISSIVQRYEADCAVNAGFSYNNGRPAGMVVMNNHLLSNSTGQFPILLINQQGVSLISSDPEKIFVYSDGKKYLISGVNVEGPDKGAYVYTPIYGDKYIATKPSIIVEVVNNRVSRFYKAEEKNNICEIPQNGFIIAYIESNIETVNSIFSTDGLVVVDKLIEQDESTSLAYECGSWLIRDGKNVATEIDPWLGALNQVKAKTIVGINKENNLVFMIVEQPLQREDNTKNNHREVMTTNEMIAYLEEKGIINAALLNGGEYSQMMVSSKLVNDINNDEIPLGVAFVISKKRLLQEVSDNYSAN